MKTKNKFHGIILGIYADMIGKQYENAFVQALRQKEKLGDSLGSIVQVLRETHDFENVEGKWFAITGNSDLWDGLNEYLNSTPKFSDDTVLTCATIAALQENQKKPNFAKYYHLYGNRYPNAGFGDRFLQWLNESVPTDAYGATTNGALMRLAPIGYLDLSPSEAKRLAYLSVNVTHNSIQCQISADRMMLLMQTIMNSTASAQSYNMLYQEKNRALIDNLPQLPYDKFDYQAESTFANVLSILWHSISADNLIYNMTKTGGDTDTIGMIAGSIYGAQKDFTVPEYMQRYVYDRLPEDLRELVF